MKRWWIIGVAGTVVGLSVLGMIWRGWPTRVKTTVPVQPRGVDDSASPPLAGVSWRVGSAQHYRVTFDSAMQMGAAGVNAMQTTISVRMNCLLDFHTLEVFGQEAVVGMRLSGIDLLINGNSDPQTNQILTAPFRVHFTAGGVPETFEFPPGLTARHRSMLENLVRTFQVTMADAKTWTVQESNASGTYEATYHRIAQQRVEKTKAEFHSLTSLTMLEGAQINSSEAFKIAPERDWIVAMTVDEVLRSKGRNGMSMVITNKATLNLKDAAQTVDPDAWRFVAAAAPEPEANAPVPDVSPEQARQRIMAVLPELDAAPEGRSRWIHQLRDLLRVDDSLPAMLLEEMRTQPLGDRTRADLYLALELAGTPSAQAALVSVIEDVEWSGLDAMRAVVALAGVHLPTAETLAALWDAADSLPSSDDRQSLASTAALALGNLGSTMNTTGDPDYPTLRDRLLGGALSGVGSTVFDEQRTAYVFALGNTGDASLADNVLMLLDDDAPSVRRAAALSLGVLAADQVADDLMVRLSGEQSSQVRGAIAESLTKWTAPTAAAMDSIGNAIRSEPDENARYNMARFLGANLDRFPENKEILQDVLRTERSKRIRQRVAESLAAVSK